jgi:hypothetical protein
MGFLSEEFTARIQNKSARERVFHFLEHDLEFFAKELDHFSELISREPDGLLKKSSEHLKNLVDAIVLKAEESTQGLDRKFVEEIGSVFRRVRPQYYYASLIVEKGFKKERGYPGDYEMMNYVYNCQPCSITKMGRYWDYYFVNDAYAQAVRGRKNKMVEILRRYIKENCLKNIRILNLPCGPARDIKELMEFKELNKAVGVEVLCVDQDPEALHYARGAITAAPQNCKVTFMQGNIVRYIRDKERFVKELGPFDLVYSIGIADYLPDRLLEKMVLFSWKLLKGGGRITYAFKIKDKDPAAPLPPKWFCDWHFISRNLDDAIGVIKRSGIDNYFFEDVVWEDSGRIAFLTVRKKR